MLLWLVGLSASNVKNNSAVCAFSIAPGTKLVTRVASSSNKLTSQSATCHHLHAAAKIDPCESLGYPDDPAWGWDKASPKKSLWDPSILGPDLPSDQSWSAKSWELNLVQLVHWLPVIPAILMARSVFHNVDSWNAIFDGSLDRMLFMLLSPIVAFVGGLPGIMMHTYEGWQVCTI